MKMDKIEKNMVKGKRASLFPVLPESKKEERATSILLSVFQLVPDFARAVLEEAGAPIGKRSEISCYTEVSFKGMDESSRPDGLIVVESKKGTWAALIEAKVGSGKVEEAQALKYVDIAKEQGFDAVITISNEFAGDPSHHPLGLSKFKRRGIALFHFSWLAIVSAALLLRDSKKVNDIEQAHLLLELVRFMESEKTGMSHSLRMSKAWKQVFEDIHQGHDVHKTSSEAHDASSDWLQLMRFLSIKLSQAVGEACSTHITKKHLEDPHKRLLDTVCDLTKSKAFTSEIKIPNAASKLRVSADMTRKTLDLSVRLETRRDTKQQRAAINFVLSQLKSCNSKDLMVVVNWPKTSPATKCTLEEALDEDLRKKLLKPELNALPTSIDIVRVVDLGVKMKQERYLPEVSEREVRRFYEEILQNLKKPTPQPPKVRAESSVTKIEDPIHNADGVSPIVPAVEAERIFHTERDSIRLDMNGKGAASPAFWLNV